MKNRFVIHATIISLFIIAAIVLGVIGSGKRSATSDYSEAKGYIASLADKNVSEVEAVIRQAEASREEADGASSSTHSPVDPADAGEDKEYYIPEDTGEGDYCPYPIYTDKVKEALEKVEEDRTYIWEIFDRTIIVGDSVMTGFLDYLFIPKERVLAEVGCDMDVHLPSVYDAIVAAKPEYLLIRYGLNEMERDEGYLDDFIKVYEENLAKITEALPNTKVIVLALSPVKDFAIEEHPRFAHVQEYNDAIRAICVKLGIAYEEDDEVFLEHPDWYYKDGIHYMPEMYYEWMTDLIEEMGLY